MQALAKVISSGVEHTERLGEYVARTIGTSGAIFLFGDLAAGKTAFVRGFVRHFSPTVAKDVHSPTYALMNQYQTTLPIYHLDLYRVESWEAFLDLGLAEALAEGQTSCIEWPKEWLQPHFNPCLSVHFKHLEDDRRELAFHFCELPKNFDPKTIEEIV